MPVLTAAQRRRRFVCAVVAVAGAGVLAWSLRIDPGSALFTPAALLLAAIWVGGALLSGPVALGSVRRPSPERWLGPLLAGLLLAGIFVLGALLVREVPWLAARVEDVLAHADEGSLLVIALVTAVTGVGEELFFRGALWAALPRPLLWTTLTYVAITAVTGNLMLTFASALLGVVTGLQRRATGGVLAPVITHVTWSLSMLVALPPVLS